MRSHATDSSVNAVVGINSALNAAVTHILWALILHRPAQEPAMTEWARTASLYDALGGFGLSRACKTGLDPRARRLHGRF